jgi:beta-lactamase regulating signal transducer with metallopeptidase domain
MQAASIPELNQLFIAATPPPFVTQNNTGSHASAISNRSGDPYSYLSSSKKENRTRRHLVWIGIVLILSLVTYIIYANNQSAYISPFSTQKSAEELKIDLAQTEKQNPTNYISGSTSN